MRQRENGGVTRRRLGTAAGRREHGGGFISDSWAKLGCETSAGGVNSGVLGEMRMPMSHSRYKPLHSNGNGPMTTVVVRYAVHIASTAEIDEYKCTSPRPRPTDRVLLTPAPLLLLLIHDNLSAPFSDRWPYFLVVLDVSSVSNGRIRGVRSAAERGSLAQQPRTTGPYEQPSRQISSV